MCVCVCVCVYADIHIYRDTESLWECLLVCVLQDAMATVVMVWCVRSYRFDSVKTAVCFLAICAAFEKLWVQASPQVFSRTAQVH